MMGLDMMAIHRLCSLEIGMMGLDTMAMHTQAVDMMGLHMMAMSRLYT